MSVCYKKLWKLLIDKNMKKKDLMEMAALTGYTMNRLAHDDDVNTESLARICNALHCRIEDIVEMIPDEATHINE